MPWFVAKFEEHAKAIFCIIGFLQFFSLICPKMGKKLPCNEYFIHKMMFLVMCLAIIAVTWLQPLELLVPIWLEDPVDGAVKKN